MMAKKIFRDDMLATLNTLSEKEYATLSQMIKNHLIQLKEYIEADTIGLTVSRFPEVNTRPIIEAAWSAGKRIVVPKCHAKSRTMDFRLITSYDDLEVAYYNLLEPKIETTQSVANEKIDLQIVPGVIFSDEGYRIGFGGGYYDRYMVDFKGQALSLAFDCQTSQQVPVEVHDIPVGKIVTEKRLINCRKGTHGN